MSHYQNVERDNLKKVYYMFLEKESLTRRDIVNTINMTYPTAGKMIEMLLAKELITLEGMSKSTGGRRAERYKINYQRFFVVCLSLKVDYVIISLVTLNGEIIHKEEIPFDYSNDLEAKLVAIVKDFLVKIGSNKMERKLLGLSLSFPGIVDDSQARCIYSTIVKVSNLNLKEVLEDNFSLPVWVENDVNLMALGESYFENINSQKGLLYIFWETGIGSAIMFDNKNVKSEFAGQIGHIIVEPNGELCFCGKRGCLETVLSKRSLINQVKTRLASNVKSTLRKYEEIELLNILKEAQEGDSLSQTVVEKIENSLGLALVNYVELFDPDRIILNGDIFRKTPFLVEKLKDYIYSQVMFKDWRKLVITTSKLGNKAEVLGLLVLVRKKELSNQLDRLFGYK